MLFTFSVGFNAVLVTVNLTVILAPVVKEKPVQATAFSAVPAAVEQECPAVLDFAHDVVLGDVGRSVARDEVGFADEVR